MYNIIVNRIIYYFSLVYLIISILDAKFSIFGNMGTDGLTLYGNIIALFLLVAIKIKTIKKIIFFLIFRFNLRQIDYNIGLTFYTENKIDLDKIYLEYIKLQKKNCSKEELSIDLKKKSNIRIEIFHRDISANFKLLKILKEPDDFSNYNDIYDDYNEQKYMWKFSFDGVSVFNKLEKNSRFLFGEFLESMASNYKMEFENAAIKINKKNSEFKMEYFYNFIDVKNYNLLNAEMEITTRNDCLIKISYEDGIKLFSDNRGNILNMLDELKNVVIS